MLSEFGPSHHLGDFDEINNSNLMSLEEMNVFVLSRIESMRSSKEDKDKIAKMIDMA